MQGRFDLDRLMGQHPDVPLFGCVTRVAHAYDVGTFTQGSHGTPGGVWRQRRDERIVSTEDFDCRICDRSMRAGFLHHSHEFTGVCWTKKLHDRKQGPGD